MRLRELVLLAACGGLGQAGSPPEDLVERVSAAPPEIAAWLLLKGATPERVPSKERRMALVEEAYQLASQARMPFPLARATDDVISDSLAGKRQEASLQHLDGLGLQVRAVRAMMNLSPVRAQAMALAMSVPVPPKAACGDEVVPRVDEYYGLALEMARRGFTAQQREDGRPLQFLTHVVAMSSRPAQLLGSVRLVAQFQTSEKDRALLVSTLNAALRSAPADARAFGAVPELDEAINGLASQLADPSALAEAYRFFVGAQEAKACPAAEPSAGLFATGPAKEISEAVDELRSAADQEDGEWASRFAALLHRLESWRAEQGQNQLEFFEAKTGLYRRLLDLAAEDTLLSNTLASFVGFLRDAPEKTESPAEWVAQFRRVLLPWAPAGQRSVEMAREEIRRGGDAMMSLLADAGATF